MTAKQIFEQLRKARTDEAFHDDPLDPARRKRQLAARPPGHQTAMLRKRSDMGAQQLVQSMRRKHAGAGAPPQA
jgi:hypothetical protein